jgi:hypothetical protein
MMENTRGDSVVRDPLIVPMIQDIKNKLNEEESMAGD